eukprot:TRINITY_DN17139_c0_g1_i1.p1 TRINITY_DN17139_c0_g1~~TRINITY_DN17139_c0_g1_i1.p1  ORF type:complete len:228 (-),score=32.59 TRINITY_DN17139_c0_g1_i1:40-723(-)
MHALSGIPTQYGVPVAEEEAKRIRGSYKCSKCGQSKKGHKCPQLTPEIGGIHLTGDSMYDAGMSYGHPQISHMLKTIAHLENSVKILHQQNHQLRELLAKYEGSVPYSQEALPAYAQDGYATTGLDYSTQFEAYQSAVANQRVQASLMGGLDYTGLGDVGLKPEPQYLPQPMPSFSRMGPSFEVDERYQVSSHPEVSPYAGNEPTSVYADPPHYASMAVTLDGSGRQ